MKRNYIRPGIKMKPRFETMEARLPGRPWGVRLGQRVGRVPLRSREDRKEWVGGTKEGDFEIF